MAPANFTWQKEPEGIQVPLLGCGGLPYPHPHREDSFILLSRLTLARPGWEFPCLINGSSSKWNKNASTFLFLGGLIWGIKSHRCLECFLNKFSPLSSLVCSEQAWIPDKGLKTTSSSVGMKSPWQLGSRSACWKCGLSCCTGTCTFLKGSGLSLMFRDCLEILEKFWTEGPAFSFCTGPCKLWSWA